MRVPDLHVGDHEFASWPHHLFPPHKQTQPAKPSWNPGTHCNSVQIVPPTHRAQPHSASLPLPGIDLAIALRRGGGNPAGRELRGYKRGRGAICLAGGRPRESPVMNDPAQARASLAKLTENYQHPRRSLFAMRNGCARAARGGDVSPPGGRGAPESYHWQLIDIAAEALIVFPRGSGSLFPRCLGYRGPE